MNFKILPYLVVLSAISVSTSAAYYSIYGLSKLFSGAEIPVIIMATTLEISKLIIATTLHRYWNTITMILRVYLVIATIILMVITSAGIYGYLSNAYQLTYSKDLQTTKQIELVELKKVNYTTSRDELLKEKTGVINSIDQLRNSLGNNVQQTVDRKTGQLIKTTSNENRKSFERQLDDAVKRRDRISDQISVLNDSITNSEIKIIEIQNNSSTSSELGPLKYLSNLTGKDMNVIVNWFLILLIIVFDPLAIALVLTSSFIFLRNNTLSSPRTTDKIESNIISEEKLPTSTDNVNDYQPEIISEKPIETNSSEHIDKFIEEVGLHQEPEIIHEVFADESDYDAFYPDTPIKKKK